MTDSNRNLFMKETTAKFNQNMNLTLKTILGALEFPTITKLQLKTSNQVFINLWYDNKLRHNILY